MYLPIGGGAEGRGAALAVKRMMLDYHKKYSPLGRAKGRGKDGTMDDSVFVSQMVILSHFRPLKTFSPFLTFRQTANCRLPTNNQQLTTNKKRHKKGFLPLS